MKNEFVTNELVRFANIVPTPQFADAGSMEDYNAKTTNNKGYGCRSCF